jgi:bacterioferritin-associated ferredoxin
VKSILIPILNQARIRAVIVCHCNQVSDREIRRVIREGACTTREIAQACEASLGCGGCRPAVLEILASETEPVARQHPPVAAPLSALSAS